MVYIIHILIMITGILISYQNYRNENTVYMKNFDNSGNVFQNCEMIISASIFNSATFDTSYIFVNSGGGLRSGPFFIASNFLNDTVMSLSNPSGYLENCTGHFIRRFDNGSLANLNASDY